MDRNFIHQAHTLLTYLLFFRKNLKFFTYFSFIFEMLSFNQKRQFCSSNDDGNNNEKNSDDKKPALEEKNKNKIVENENENKKEDNSLEKSEKTEKEKLKPIDRARILASQRPNWSNPNTSKDTKEKADPNACPKQVHAILRDRTYYPTFKYKFHMNIDPKTAKNLTHFAVFRQDQADTISYTTGISSSFFLSVHFPFSCPYFPLSSLLSHSSSLSLSFLFSPSLPSYSSSIISFFSPSCVLIAFFPASSFPRISFSAFYFLLSFSSIFIPSPS